MQNQYDQSLWKIYTAIYLVSNTYYEAQLSATDALGLELEQHTHHFKTAQLKSDMHAKVGRWRWGWQYRIFQHTRYVN